MNFTKAALLFLFAFTFIGCASAQKEDEIPEVKPDPVIELEAKRNAKLYRQSEKQMLKSLQLPTITYEFDSIRPPDYAYPFLDKVANIMKDQPQLHLIIEGHTDIIGSKEYNYWLSGSRAAAMKSYLVSRGIPADAIRIHAHGKDRPLTLDNSDEGRRTNRRVEFTFTTRDWKAVF